MSDFERAHEFTARWEGSYSNHAADTGGETNLGVTKRVWLNWCARQNLTPKPMRSLTLADVLPLYRESYWEPYAASYPWPLSAAAYDIAVNHGPGNLKFMMQDASGVTPLARALSLCNAREQFYRSIVSRNTSQSVFLKGWLRRVNDQRRWLKDNATPENPTVLLVPMGGGTPVMWDQEPVVYGGVTLTPALIEQLRTVYPTPGTYTYEGLRVYMRRSGDVVLERASLSTP